MQARPARFGSAALRGYTARALTLQGRQLLLQDSDFAEDLFDSVSSLAAGKVSLAMALRIARNGRDRLVFNGLVLPVQGVDDLVKLLYGQFVFHEQSEFGGGAV